jgi:hypothetical protein
MRGRFVSRSRAAAAMLPCVCSSARRIKAFSASFKFKGRESIMETVSLSGAVDPGVVDSVQMPRFNFSAITLNQSSLD